MKSTNISFQKQRHTTLLKGVFKLYPLTMRNQLYFARLITNASNLPFVVQPTHAFIPQFVCMDRSYILILVITTLNA